ncbi:polysaccharide deacetylase family protein [Paenibacillus cellulosilyticus]|nr:polysaccharide deacetylase family protein [Paenibacillus cellulosilyticus]QKS46555.1 polysaccharide deacetylase family protein [Paenibacillus cellulosilyticus]
MLKASVPLTLALALAACGAAGKNNSETDSPPAAVQPSDATDKQSEATVPDTTAAAPDSTGSTTTTTPPAAETTDPAPPEDTKPVQAEQTKLYKMSKVYRFVPIDKTTTTDKVVLLTFDDGPKDEKQVTEMLDILDKHKAKAIFFVNGYRVKVHPELVKLIHDRGQTVGNHSWDHIDLKKESKESIEKQIGDVSKQVEDIIGEAPKFFRPPFGSGNDNVRTYVKDNGMLYMTWSNGSLDWDTKNKNKPDAVIANVLEQLHPGANILMHELPWTIEALDELLTKLEAKGYGFIDPATIETDPDAAATTTAAKDGAATASTVK